MPGPGAAPGPDPAWGPGAARGPGAIRGAAFPAWAASAVLRALAVLVTLTGCGAVTPAPRQRPVDRRVPAVRLPPARPAPAGWHTTNLPGHQATLAYPPAMHLIKGDQGAVSAAELSPSGAFLMYLNATPRQGRETLADWPGFRVEHLTDEDASSARLIAASRGVRFLGGTGTCVIDAYVTRVKSHHYTEIACFVRGRTAASVIVAAAPTARWASESALLLRAVAAYEVH